MKTPSHLHRAPRGQRRCTKCQQHKPLLDFTRYGRVCNNCHAEPGALVITPIRPGASGPGRLCNTSTSDDYTGAELRPFDGRPGAMDAFDKPSRIGNALTWRDGRAEKLEMK